MNAHVVDTGVVAVAADRLEQDTVEAAVIDRQQSLDPQANVATRMTRMNYEANNWTQSLDCCRMIEMMMMMMCLIEQEDLRHLLNRPDTLMVMMVPSTTKPVAWRQS